MGTPSHPKQEEIGKKYNMLTILEWAGRKLGQPQYLFRCDCGNEKILTYSKVTSGGTKSCGCLILERLSKVLWTTTPRENYQPNHLKIR